MTAQVRDSSLTTTALCLEAALGALDDAGLDPSQVDGLAARWSSDGGTVMSPGSLDWASALGLNVTWIGDTYPAGIPAVMDAVAAISAGYCSVVLIFGGQAGARKHDVAPYTFPLNEFSAVWGATTPVHFAMAAHGYYEKYGPDPSDLARVAAAIRNIGSRNPEALMYARGPYNEADVLNSPMVAEPFRLLELCLTNDGAAAIVVTSAEVAEDCRQRPVYVTSCAAEWRGQQYVSPPSYHEMGDIGEASLARVCAIADVKPSDIDLLQLYDPNVYEIVRQIELLGLCGLGEGAAWCASKLSDPGRPFLNTDGGLLSFGHIGWSAPTLKIVEAVRQLRGDAALQATSKIETVLATGAGSGAQYFNAALFQC